MDDALAHFLLALPWPGYAPRFEVLLDGVPLLDTVVRDVLEVTVTLDLGEASGFQFKVNNSDAGVLGRLRALGGPKFPTKYSDLSTFDVGRRVHIRMGYGRALCDMISGKVTGLTVQFPESGASTLDVTGVDDFVQLRDREPVDYEKTRFEGMSDAEVLGEIAERAGLDFNYIPKPSTGGNENKTLHRELAHHSDDLTLLLNRTRRTGHDAFVRTEPHGGSTLWVVPRDQITEHIGGNTYPLTWGENLISFSPTLNAARQVESVTVRGWDIDAKKVIEYTADAASLGLGGRSGPAMARAVYQTAKKIKLTDDFVDSAKEAEELAVSTLRGRADEYVTGSGRCMGNPLMRQGDSVRLGGLGRRFDGLYVMGKVTHTINASGYLTEFEIRRPDDGGTAEAGAQ